MSSDIVDETIAASLSASDDIVSSLEVEQQQEGREDSEELKIEPEEEEEEEEEEDDVDSEDEEPNQQVVAPVPLSEIDEKAEKGRVDQKMDVEIAVVDDNFWPMMSLYPSDSWVLHHLYLDKNSKKPGIRAIITKTERCGPKTLPFTEYVIHIKTAFSVRAISRRFKDFRGLDEQLRSEFGNIPALPKKKVFGHMKPRFVESRKKQLQNYLNQCLAQRKIASCQAMKQFLQIQGHGVEESIVDGNIREPTPAFKFWEGDINTYGIAAREAALVCAANEDVVGEAEANNRLALVLAQTADSAQGVSLLEWAAQKCIENDNPFGAIACTSNLGCILLLQGHIPMAVDKLARTLDAVRKLQPADRDDLPVPEAVFMRNLSIAHACMGNISASLQVADGIVQLCEQMQDGSGAAGALYLKGCVQYICGEVRQSVEALEAALVLRRKYKEKIFLAETLCKLGSCFSDIGYNLHAMDYFDQALALAQEVGDRKGEATCLMWLGRVNHLHGDAQAGARHLQEAYDIYKKYRNVAGLARVHLFLSCVCADSGDHVGSVKHAKSCVSLLTRLATPPQWAKAAITECKEREEAERIKVKNSGGTIEETDDGNHQHHHHHQHNHHVPSQSSSSSAQQQQQQQQQHRATTPNRTTTTTAETPSNEYASRDRGASPLSSASSRETTEQRPSNRYPNNNNSSSSNNRPHTLSERPKDGKDDTSFTLAFKLHLPGKALSSHLRTLRGVVSQRYKFD